MTMPIQFDTLEYVRRLTEAGISRDHAEAQAQALGDALSHAVVVPSEIVLLKSDLLARMDILKQEIYIRMDVLKQEMYTGMDALKQEMYTGMDALKQEIYAHVSAEITALRVEFNAKFTTLYWMVGISLAMNAVTLAMVAKLMGGQP